MGDRKTKFAERTFIRDDQGRCVTTLRVGTHEKQRVFLTAPRRASGTDVAPLPRMNEVVAHRIASPPPTPPPAAPQPSRTQRAPGFDVARERSAKILAKSFFRELKGNGYTHEQILALSTELIGLVTSDIDAAQPEHVVVKRPSEPL